MAEESSPSASSVAGKPAVDTLGAGDVRMLRRLVRAMPAAVALVDRAGHVLAWSDAWERLTGVEASNGKRTQIVELFVDQEPWRDALQRALGGKEALGKAELERYSDEAAYWVDWEIRPWHTRAGEVGGALVSFTDVTEQKLASDAMAATNAALKRHNQTLREFAYIASHDLQEPLRKISAFADLMREDYSEAVDETGTYYLERMQDATRRMSALINDLLAYSRVTMQSDRFEAVALDDVVRDVQSDLELRIQEQQGRVEVGDLPTIEADPTQMRQLLQNLIGNGLKFHRAEVPPVVQVNAVIVEEDAPGSDATMRRVCRLVVTDNGVGIEEKYLDRIFAPFKRLHPRRNYQGNGMGLAICQRIVERHGGTIAVTSTPGTGSAFTVTLPASQSEAVERADWTNDRTGSK